MNEDAIAPNQDIPIESGSTPISAPASVEEEVGIEQFDSPPGALETVDFQEILKRPEALVLLAFTLVVLAWQFYLALLDDVAPEGSLNTRELADRLQVSRSTISRRKTQPDFSVWSQQLDPDAIAWAYSEGKFIPQLYQPELLDSGS